MSILAQARLTSLSQRYLSMQAWRYDSVQSRLQRPRPGDRGELATSTNVEHSYEPSCLKPYYNDHSLRIIAGYDTPSRHKRGYKLASGWLTDEGTQRLNKINPILRTEKPSSNTSRGSFIGHGPRSLSSFDSLTTNQSHGTFCRLYRKPVKYIFEHCEQRHGSRSTSSNPEVQSPNSNQMSSPASSSNDDHSDNHSGRERRVLHPESFLVAFSVVGVINNLTSKDENERKAMLTDEEKIAKMTPAELLIAKGVFSMMDKNHDKADDFFHQALHIAQDEGNEEQETLIFNLLASNYYDGGDLESAEKLFIDLIKRYMARGAEVNDPAILELSLKLASIYSEDPTKRERATTGYKFVIKSLMNNLRDSVNDFEDLESCEVTEDKRDELALLGWSYDWFGKHLLVLNDYYGAVEMMKKALQISIIVLGPIHEQTLILFNDVGTTLAMNNSPDEGLEFIKKAVEGAIECQSRELASFYANLGLVNLRLKRLQEAKRYCENSIELASKNIQHYNSSQVLKLSRGCLKDVERLLEVGDNKV